MQWNFLFFVFCFAVNLCRNHPYKKKSFVSSETKSSATATFSPHIMTYIERASRTTKRGKHRKSSLLPLIWAWTYMNLPKSSWTYSKTNSMVTICTLWRLDCEFLKKWEKICILLDLQAKLHEIWIFSHLEHKFMSYHFLYKSEL